MLEQDFIMRMIYQMVRFLLEILFDIDSEVSIKNIDLEDKNLLRLRERLLSLLDQENFNEAEDFLFQSMDRKNPDNFKLAILFYRQLNEYPDETLENRNFSREEIWQGMEDVLQAYGQKDLLRVFRER